MIVIAGHTHTHTRICVCICIRIRIRTEQNRTEHAYGIEQSRQFDGDKVAGQSEGLSWIAGPVAKSRDEPTAV